LLFPARIIHTEVHALPKCVRSSATGCAAPSCVLPETLLPFPSKSGAGDTPDQSPGSKVPRLAECVPSISHSCVAVPCSARGCPSSLPSKSPCSDTPSQAWVEVHPSRKSVPSISHRLRCPGRRVLPENVVFPSRQSPRCQRCSKPASGPEVQAFAEVCSRSSATGPAARSPCSAENVRLPSRQSPCHDAQASAGSEVQPSRKCVPFISHRLR